MMIETLDFVCISFQTVFILHVFFFCYFIVVYCFCFGMCIFSNKTQKKYSLWQTTLKSLQNFSRDEHLWSAIWHSLLRGGIRKSMRGVVIMIRKWFSRPIRGNQIPFFLREKNRSRGWQSPTAGSATVSAPTILIEQFLCEYNKLLSSCRCFTRLYITKKEWWRFSINRFA
jgi:hypothetical protein